MKIFFTASKIGTKQFGASYNKIQSYVREHNYVLLENNVGSNEPSQLLEALETGDHKVQVEFYQKKINAIKEADVCIFEVSTQSLSTGFIIQKALELNKPVIVLYMKGYAPYFLDGVENEKLMLREYEPETLEKKLTESLEAAIDLREKRFNFFISPSLLTYLEAASKKDGITKSTFIRNLILSHKKKHA